MHPKGIDGLSWDNPSHLPVRSSMHSRSGLHSPVRALVTWRVHRGPARPDSSGWCLRYRGTWLGRTVTMTVWLREEMAHMHTCGKPCWLDLVTPKSGWVAGFQMEISVCGWGTQTWDLSTGECCLQAPKSSAGLWVQPRGSIPWTAVGLGWEARPCCPHFLLYSVILWSILGRILFECRKYPSLQCCQKRGHLNDNATKFLWGHALYEAILAVGHG